MTRSILLLKPTERFSGDARDECRRYRLVSRGGGGFHAAIAISKMTGSSRRCTIQPHDMGLSIHYHLTTTTGDQALARKIIQ